MKVKETLVSNKNESMDMDKLPLPNINNLRKWINNEKKDWFYHIYS